MLLKFGQSQTSVPDHIKTLWRNLPRFWRYVWGQCLSLSSRDHKEHRTELYKGMLVGTWYREAYTVYPAPSMACSVKGNCTRPACVLIGCFWLTAADWRVVAARRRPPRLTPLRPRKFVTSLVHSPTSIGSRAAADGTCSFRVGDGTTHSRGHLNFKEHRT